MIGGLSAVYFLWLGCDGGINDQLAANNGFNPVTVCQLIELYAAK
jgi:hypothetical protein